MISFYNDSFSFMKKKILNTQKQEEISDHNLGENDPLDKFEETNAKEGTNRPESSKYESVFPGIKIRSSSIHDHDIKTKSRKTQELLYQNKTPKQKEEAEFLNKSNVIFFFYLKYKF